MRYLKPPFVLLSFLALSLSASASMITWTAAAFTDATQIDPSGNILATYNFGSAATIDVNGVSFVGNNAASLDDTYFRFGFTGAKQNFSSATAYNDANAIAGLSVADANALLDAFSWNDQNNTNWLMTVKNLEIGQTYTIQAIVVDDRAAQSGRNMHFGPDGATWGAAYDYSSAGAPLLATGTFVADATTQQFRNGVQGTGGPQLNALVISSAIPEPSSLGLVLLGAGLIVARLRK